MPRARASSSSLGRSRCEAVAGLTTGKALCDVRASTLLILPTDSSSRTHTTPEKRQAERPPSAARVRPWNPSGAPGRPSGPSSSPPSAASAPPW